MFGFGRKKVDDRKEVDQSRHHKDDHRYAVLQGQFSALFAVVSMVIDRLPADGRRSLDEVLKRAAGQGFAGEGVHVDELHRQTYKNAMSAVMQNFIDQGKQAPDSKISN